MGNSQFYKNDDHSCEADGSALWQHACCPGVSADTIVCNVSQFRA